MKSFTDEMEARVVSKRGPYDLFTGERNKPISVGYFALPVSLMISFEDGAYFCYCAYVLCILRYSGFQWVVPTNTGIFLRGLKQCGEGRT